MATVTVPQFRTSIAGIDAFDARTRNLEDSRARRLQLQANQLNYDQALRKDTTDQAVDAAIRESMMPQAQGMPQQSGAPMIQSQDLAPGAAPVSTPVSPAVAGASPGLTGAPRTMGGQQIQPHQNGAQLSPFDTPEFTANLTRRLASIPGAGAKIMELRKERDAQITSILEQAANGNVDTARYLAQQNGLNIPEQLFQNGELARGMTLSAKAYPDEPDKAQVFFQRYMSSPGSLDEKVNAGIAAAGRPTTASQRQLANSIALLKYKAANPQLTVTDPYKRYQNVGGVGLVDLAAEGGPAVAIGPTFNYQKALQDNIKSLASASMGTKNAEQIYQDAKMLTDRMAAASNAQATQTQPYQVQAPVAVSPSVNLLPPPVPGQTPDPAVFATPVAPMPTGAATATQGYSPQAQQYIEKARAAGYSDEQIREYLNSKGIR